MSGMSRRTTLDITLTPLERDVLRAGLGEWGGAAGPTDQVAQLIGFHDVDDLMNGCLEIRERLGRGEPLTPADWRRALRSTELAFISDEWGAGVEWSTVTGLSDEEAITALRSLQRALVTVGTTTLRAVP